MDPSTQPIIEAAAEFLWSDELQESLDTFARNHASMFAGCTNTASEQKLEWTEAHLDFQSVFELHLEQFITAQDFTAEQFLAACQDAVTQEEPVPGSTLCKSMVEVVIAMQGYEHFVEMMIEAANQEEAGETTFSPFIAASPVEC